MGERISKFCLKNGLGCCYRQLDYFENYATMALVVKAGSTMEQDGEKGIAHLLEHLLMSFWTYNLYDKVRYKTEAHTDFYDTIYYVKGPVDNNNLLGCIQILYDIASGKFLEEKYFSKAKEDVLKEIQKTKEKNKTAQLLLKNSLYCDFFAIGRESDVRDLEFKDVKAFFDKYYSAGSMELEVVGDIKDIEEVHGYVKNLFENLESFDVHYESKMIPIPEYKGEVYFTQQLDKEELEKQISVFMKVNQKRFLSKQVQIKEEIIEKIAFQLFLSDLEKELGDEGLDIDYTPMDLDAFHMFYSISITVKNEYDIGIHSLLNKVKEFFQSYAIPQSVKETIGESLDCFKRIERDRNAYYEEIGMHQLLLECIDSYTMQKAIVPYDEKCDLYENISPEIEEEEVIKFVNEILLWGRVFIVYL